MADPRFDDFEKRIAALEDAVFKKREAVAQKPAKRTVPVEAKPVATKRSK